MVTEAWQAGVFLWRVFGTVMASMSQFVVAGGVPRFRFRRRDGKDETWRPREPARPVSGPGPQGPRPSGAERVAQGPQRRAGQHEVLEQELAGQHR